MFLIARINSEQIQCSSQQIKLVFSFIILARYLLTEYLSKKAQETYSCFEALFCHKNIAPESNTAKETVSVTTSLYVASVLFM